MPSSQNVIIDTDLEGLSERYNISLPLLEDGFGDGMNPGVLAELLSSNSATEDQLYDAHDRNMQLQDYQVLVPYASHQEICDFHEFCRIMDNKYYVASIDTYAALRQQGRSHTDIMWAFTGFRNRHHRAVALEQLAKGVSRANILHMIVHGAPDGQPSLN